MKTPARSYAAILLTAAMLVVSSGAAHAAFDSSVLECRSAIGKAGAKLTKSVLKSFASCHKSENKGLAVSSNCNDSFTSDVSGKLPGAKEKFVEAVTSRCTGVAPADALYGGCPLPCDTDVTGMSTFDDVATCLICLDHAKLKQFATEAYGSPATTVISTEDRACHSSITKISSKLINSIMKTVTKCQAADEKSGIMTTDHCTDTGFQTLLGTADTEAYDSLLTGPCATVPLPGTLDPCGGATDASQMSACVINSSVDSAQEIVSLYLELPEIPTTTTTTTTTTTLPPSIAACPTDAILTASAHFTSPCSSNAECAGEETCDEGAGHCATVTAVDLGQAGFSHGQDINDGDSLHLSLSCQGPASPGCGQCDVAGVAPGDNCRCSNDSSIVCSAISDASSDCPSSAPCVCFASTPTPLTAGGVSGCMVSRFSPFVSGTLSLDSGAASITLNTSRRIYLSEFGLLNPCPACGGVCSNNSAASCVFDEDCDSGGVCNLDTAGDGVRGGRCVGGEDDGDSCEIHSSNSGLPIGATSTGAGYSYDCQPSIGKNISGTGIQESKTLTTGASSLASTLPCGEFPDENCPCRMCNGSKTPCNSDADCSSLLPVCSGDDSVTCSSNADCENATVGICNIGHCSQSYSTACTSNSDCREAVDLGTCGARTCSSDGNSGQSFPNSCDNFECTDTGSGAGECTTGPDDQYCDGIVELDGSGLIPCQFDSDCAPEFIGVDGGDCTIVERRRCFPDTISVSGSPDASSPVLASSHCLGATDNTAVNTIVGLPGAARSVTQESLSGYCLGSAAAVYTPGVGCP